MANQTITVDSNHDELTGRLAGEDITANNGAKLTIDSMPHLTPMGILGRLLINLKCELHIDGTRTFEIAYSGGSGTLPIITEALSWNLGVDTGKAIELLSGDNTSGVIVITVSQGSITPQIGDILQGDTWTATVDSIKVGYLKLYCEDNDWTALDATSTWRITGDWYELGVGDGLDNQTFTLPHNGVQHAIWVETGVGTDVFEIWHRVYNGNDSTAFFDQVTDWGGTFESGYVFGHIPFTNTLVFGTASNGGAPPLGARIRIPNVHIATTTVAQPTTEVVSTSYLSYVGIISGAKGIRWYIDHLNCSTAHTYFSTLGDSTIEDSCFSISQNSYFLTSPVGNNIFRRCAFVAPYAGIEGLPTVGYATLDVNTLLIFEDCIFVKAENTASSPDSFEMVTSNNITFRGRTKVPLVRQNESSACAVRLNSCSNIRFEGELILLNGGLVSAGASSNLLIENLKWGQLASRGPTEDAMSLINIATFSNLEIKQGSQIIDGGNITSFGQYLFFLNDCNNIFISNFGEVDNKIDLNGRGNYIFYVGGLSSNVVFKRMYFTNSNHNRTPYIFSTVSNVVFSNIGTDYDDEIELVGNNLTIKGIHGGSGNIGASTGVEDDYSPITGSVFYDIFKSDTEGGVGLVFNDPGSFYASSVSIDSGDILFNGIGDLVIQEVGDQITYTFPYKIQGHTGFTNILPHLLGVNAGTLGSSWGNFTVEYDLDTGSGFSGVFKTATQANLIAETISPTGFGIKIRIICLTASLTNTIRGLQIHTSTTLQAQKDNLYPLSTVPFYVKVLDFDTKLPVENARVFVKDLSDNVYANSLTSVSGEVSFSVPLDTSIDFTGSARKAEDPIYYKESVFVGTISVVEGYSSTVFLFNAG